MCMFNLINKFLKSFQSYCVLSRLINFKYYVLLMLLAFLSFLIYD